MQVPVLRRVRVVPLTVQTLAVPEVSVTASPLLAEAASVTGDGVTGSDAGVMKVMDCAVLGAEIVMLAVTDFAAA